MAGNGEQNGEQDLARKALRANLIDAEALLDVDGVPSPDGYELVRAIGRGGSGSVHLARDLNLGRQVAIKFLTGASTAELERFRREARFTARLNSPSIVKIYELGEVEDQPYIAMQYVDGPNLARAELDTRGVVRVMRDVALALKHAHAEGIVHRDIKPENILIDGEGRVFLTDFGIARDLSGSLGKTISRDGQIMGTPALMAPEQARGENQVVDARTDVYCVGSTLYRRLTGRYPFEAENVVDVLHAVIHAPVRLPRSHNASIPRSLEAIVAKCMQKAREDRYQNMDAVVAEFDRFLAGGAVESESAAWFRRLVFRLVGPAAGTDAAPPEPADDVSTDPYWTVGLEIVRKLSIWDADLYRVSGSLGPSFERLEGIRTELDGILAGRPDLAWARFYRGVVSFRRGDLDEALSDMERAIDRVRKLAGAYFELGRLYLALYLKEHHRARKHVTRSGITSELGFARRRLEQAILSFEQAQRLDEDFPPWHADYSRAVVHLSESDFDACVGVCDRILQREPDLEEVWKLRADALCFAGEDPFASYERALAVRKSYFEALCGKAEAHLERDQIDEARRALERAREIHPECVAALVILGRTYLAEAGREPSAAAPASAERRDAALLEGRRVAGKAVELDGKSYEARVGLAEILFESGRSSGEDGWLEAALEQLERAAELDGCQNRVNLMMARTTLELAGQLRSSGRDSRQRLDSVLALYRRATAQVSEQEPWEAIRVDVERELARLA